MIVIRAYRECCVVSVVESFYLNLGKYSVYYRYWMCDGMSSVYLHKLLLVSPFRRLKNCFSFIIAKIKL